MRTGHFVEDHGKQVAISDSLVAWNWTAVLLAVCLLLPFVASSFVLTLAITIGISAIGAVGLNLLTGVTGLISLGQAGFLAAGCYTTALLIADYRWPPELALLAAGLVSALLSLIIGIPSLRLKGIYLAITTLAFSFIVTHFLLYAEPLTHGPYGVRVQNVGFLGLNLAALPQMYYLVLAILILTSLAFLNLMRSRLGRAFFAIRDHDIAARAMGIDLTTYKLSAFFASSFLVGIAGGLMAFQFRFVNVDLFNILLSIEALAMIIVGGLGSLSGALLGAAFIVLLPELARALTNLLPDLSAAFSTHIYDVRGLLTGLAIIITLRFEPLGLTGLWRRISRYWLHWPLST
ncbi:branched-chain amino acid ABC transporter permease [Bradyrhizobium genosp. SA-3]|uniref:branched-chain amino acid ABC transporter permease n=1 Tax=Bradyrhizobium genosp. SA-3 TaxID=508868 RepID=UPI00102A6590|nr:branched-chain amino acid ABC transporter permease [Bradyrhizobium genosp. SA-3]RZN04501.1 branched-chain amino acid ABC transporter permease [Bradyrhizobium genosp. SA-3]